MLQGLRILNPRGRRSSKSRWPKYATNPRRKAKRAGAKTLRAVRTPSGMRYLVNGRFVSAATAKRLRARKRNPAVPGNTPAKKKRTKKQTTRRSTVAKKRRRAKRRASTKRKSPKRVAAGKKAARTRKRKLAARRAAAKKSVRRRKPTKRRKATRRAAPRKRKSAKRVAAGKKAARTRKRRHGGGRKRVVRRRRYKARKIGTARIGRRRYAVRKTKSGRAHITRNPGMKDVGKLLLKGAGAWAALTGVRMVGNWLNQKISTMSFAQGKTGVTAQLIGLIPSAGLFGASLLLPKFIKGKPGIVGMIQLGASMAFVDGIVNQFIKPSLPPNIAALMGTNEAFTFMPGYAPSLPLAEYTNVDNRFTGMGEYVDVDNRYSGGVGELDGEDIAFMQTGGAGGSLAHTVFSQ